MGDVLIRNLDERILARLKESSRRNGRSVQSEIKMILAEHTPMSMAEFAEVSRQWHERLAGQDWSDSTELIRADRDDPDR